MSFDNQRASAMDASAGGSRETQSEPAPAVPTMCRTGCGFYANSAFDGMCSKCYKDTSEHARPSTSAGTSSAAACSTLSSASSASRQSPIESSSPSAAASVIDTSSLPDVNTGSPTVLCSTDTTDNDSELGDSSSSCSESMKDKPKKKRCAVCKKRVGLTGFDCRCGGHFCSVHRYSDTHKCAFDYHELGQSEIRKHNPVIAAEKVQKI